MEVVKFQQALLINSDLDMYYAKTDTPALCRTSSLVEELGQIQYIFSDKTGTLTRNEMEFRQCSIAGIPYSDVVDENKKGEVFTFEELRANLANGHETANVIDEFLVQLATCHTVIPETKDGKITYQASSPDEAALVAGADVLGYTFTVRRHSYRSSHVVVLSLSHRLASPNRSSFVSTAARTENIRSSTSASSTVHESACRPSSGRPKAKSSYTARAPIPSSSNAFMPINRIPR